jgi:hypothetical protein
LKQEIKRRKTVVGGDGWRVGGGWVDEMERCVRMGGEGTRFKHRIGSK